MKEFLGEIFKITTTKVVIGLLSMVAITVATQVNFNSEVTTAESLDEFESLENTYSQNDKKEIERTPASKNSIQQKKRSASPVSLSPEISNKDDSNYNQVENLSEYYSANKASKSKTISNPDTYAPLSNSLQRSNINPEVSVKMPFKSLAQSNSVSNVFMGAAASSSTSFKSNDIKVNVESGVLRPPEKQIEPPVVESNDNSSSPATTTCSADILSGTFGNPFGVKINCNYNSSIKYCLAKDTCCDPQDMGTNYSTTIAIGAENGNYCLSYYGDSETGGVSEVVQNNYTVNNSYPKIATRSPKTYFQTTELIGETFFTSDDFGKANHLAGQINFKSNDPTSTGLNYSCEEIVENDHLTLIPFPSTTTDRFDISFLLPTKEIKVPLREDKLDYGINFISSYIKNNSYITPLYSCATSAITLEDFSYFEASIAQASVGDNDVREFEGQFMSYGFFEEDLPPPATRAPAGESSKDGTTLEPGLLSVFY